MREQAPVPAKRALRLRTWMLVIAAIALVLAVVPKPLLSLLLFFLVIAGIASAAAALLHLRLRVEWLTAYAWLTAFYPFITLGAFYGAWLAAWRELGHVPRVSTDDPKNIGGAFPAFEAAAWLTLAGILPVACAAFPLLTLRIYEWMTRRPAAVAAATGLASVGAVGWGMTFLVWACDPGWVFAWFFD